MKMISPSNREVDVGKTLSETEWIGMCRREVFDDFLRKRAKSLGANIVNGLMMKMEMPQGPEGPIMIQYNSYEGNSKVGAAALGRPRRALEGSSGLRAGAGAGAAAHPALPRARLTTAPVPVPRRAGRHPRHPGGRLRDRRRRRQQPRRQGD
jgi:hypothetical protein